jgi:4-amino-4-deoxy-L-arabinose transferase-like glycosyltransferase
VKIFALVLLLALTVARCWLAATADVTPPEAYHWMQSKQLDWAYFDGPGGTAALVHTGQAVFGSSPLGIRIAFPLAAVVASLAMYLLTRNLFGAAVGLTAAAFLNALPIFNLAAIHAAPTVPALAATLFAAWAAWRALDRKRDLLSWVLVGAAIAVGIQFRYATILAWPAILAVCLTSPRYRAQFRSSGLYAALLLTLAGCLPAIGWNVTHDWPTLALGTFRTAIDFDPATWPSAIGDLQAVLSIFAALFLAAAIVLGTRRSHHHLRPRFLVAWTTPFLLAWLFFALHGESDPADLLITAALAIPLAAWLAAGENRLLRTLQPAVILLTAASAAVALTSPRWNPHPWSQGDNALPWPRIAAVAETLRTEAQATQPAPIFFIAKNPAYTAALNYHLPPTAQPQSREVFLRESQDLSNQFGLWPRYDNFVETPHAPDEFFEELRAANPYTGRSALYLTDETELPQTIASAFRNVSLAATLDVRDTAGSPRTLRFYFCEDYQTMPL